MTPRDAYIALNLMDNVGPVRVRNLVEALGSLEAIFTADESALLKAAGIGREVARKIAAQRGEVDVAAELERAERAGAHVITPVDDEYPAALKNIYDPPLALYVRGRIEPRDRHGLSIIGTRNPTHYGLTVADQLGYQLAKSGFTVISGLARGIDTSAHRAALKAGGRTLAVIGSALDTLYPPENADLADAIADGHGAVISEYTMGRDADRTTFPYRNRIVSGLSLGVIVVEAGIKSGAMITTDQALEQGKTVFAVPGRIDSPSSRGTHQLIKNGARLIEGLDDVLQEFDTLLPRENKAKAEALKAGPDVPLSPEEQQIVRALWPEELDVDTLSRQSAVPIARLNALLITLEMKRVVKVLPGRRVALREEVRRRKFEI